MTKEDFELKAIIKNQTKAIIEHAMKNKFKPVFLHTKIETGEGKHPINPSFMWTADMLNNCPDGKFKPTSKYTDNNIGVLCGRPSNLIVIDIDTTDNMKSWKKVLIDGNYNTIEQFNEQWNGPIVKTPSGGYHYYFKYNENDADYYEKDNTLKGIDFQTDGKLITYPGSTYMSCYPNECETKNYKKKAHKCNCNVYSSDLCEYRGRKYEWIKSTDKYSIPELPNFMRRYFIKMTTISNPLIKINNYVDISNELIDKIIPHIGNLSTERDTWIKVIWCLTSLGATLEQCKEFSKMTGKDNYNEKDVEELYNEGSDIKWNIAGLKKLCREASMSQQVFKEIFSDVDEKNIEKYLNRGEIGIANLYVQNYKKDFITVQKSNSRSTYFIVYNFDFNTKLWCISSSSHVGKDICCILEPIINSQIYKTNIEINKLNSEEEQNKDKNKLSKLEDKKRLYTKILYKIQSTNGQNTIYEQVKILIQNKDFEKKLNSIKHSFPTKNGKVINYKTLEEKDRTISDYWSFEGGASYLKNSDCKNAIEYFESLTKVKGSKEARKDYTDYMTKILGYSLTAENSEQVFYVLHGCGSNGKSLLMNIMNKILSTDYRIADKKIFDVDNKSAHSESLQYLKGCRLAVLSEPKTGKKPDNELLKNLTGEEAISSRGLNEKAEEWVPTFKLFFLCNEVPDFKSEKAIQRRLHFLPFENEFSKNNLYKNKLMNEHLDEIFTLLARKANQFYTENKNIEMPECCKEAAEEFMEENNTVVTFLNESDRIERIQNEHTGIKDLYAIYRDFCNDKFINPINEKGFQQQMIEQGFSKKKIGTYKYIGIKILSDYERINKIQTHQQQENNRLLEEEEEEKEEHYTEIDNEIIECNKLHNCAEDFNLHCEDGDYCSTCKLKMEWNMLKKI
jgi:P4 family phage/plasmid primase-like protien